MPLRSMVRTGRQSRRQLIHSEKPERIIRLSSVLDRTGLSRSTLYRKVAQGTFPKPIRISVRSAGWRESAVNEWVRDPSSYRADQRSS